MQREEELDIIQNLPALSLQTLGQALAVGVIVVNPLRRITYYNPEAKRLLGIDSGDERLFCHRVIWKSDKPCIECPLEAEGVDPLVRELELPDRGLFVEIHAHIGENGDIVETIADITLRKNFQNELDRIALTDPSSGLFKRHFVRENLQREMRHAENAGCDVSLMLINVPELTFSDIETMPKVVARVLRSIGEVMDGRVQPYEHTYRFAHDTFAVVLPKQDMAAAMRVAKEILKRTAELGLGGARIGVAAMGNTKIADALIQSAQHALYKAARSEDPIVVG